VKKLQIILIGIVFSVCSSCIKEKFDEYESSVNTPLIEIEDANISPQFDWKTTKDIRLKLTAKGYNGQNLAVIFEVVDAKNRLLAKGTPNNNGVYETIITVPITCSEVTIYPNYLGLISQVTLSTTSTILEFNFHADASKMNFSNVIQEKTIEKNRKNRVAVSACGYLSTYDNNGVPITLENDDVLNSDFLDQVNASLPERRPVPDYHPQYIADGLNTDIRLEAEADVYITFVHEGAGYKNTLGFYTYDLDNPPTNIDEISNCQVIFPNLSFSGSGGDLHSGQKVLLGTFPSNTGIGWFLIANGWTGSSVNMGQPIYYSNPNFNPESTSDARNHMVLIKDEARELILLGFEDINRDSNSDNDFNDAVFYVTANPYSAIIIDDLPEIDISDDADNDNVSDLYDDYPNDPTRSFNNYYPSEGAYSTLAFEDLWPSKGDYDYNDLVLDYQHNRVTNNQNVIIEMISDFRITGVLAGFKHNAFAVELPIIASKVGNVSGNRISNNFFLLNGNGTESGHTNAVIPIFDHAGDNFTSATDPDPIIITTTFSTGISLNELGGTPYNPFLIVNRQRGREIHLPGNLPTILADESFFKTSHDNTDVNIDKQTYKTTNHLPWAINIVESFNYPKESVPIKDTYFYFIEWAESQGTFYPDWYENKTGYRDVNNLSF